MCLETGGYCQGGVNIINRKLIPVLVLVVLTCLCVVVCMKVLNVPREDHLATIELPSGDRIIIKYCYDDFLSALGKSSGGLKYDIYSGESHNSGQLTHSRKYEYALDVRLTHEIQGDRRVKIEETGLLYLRSWIFEGNSSGQYKVTELPPQKQN